MILVITMEYFDVLSKNRQNLNYTKSKNCKLESNEYNQGAEIWIINNGKLLMTKRSSKKSHPGEWETTGGCSQHDETSIITILREVKEETVRKAFLKGNCEVLVILEDSDREVLIDDFSPDEDIKKYLGASFINPRRQ